MPIPQHKLCHFLAIAQTSIYIFPLHSGLYHSASPFPYPQSTEWMETPFITRWFLPALSGVLLALSFPGPPLEGLASLYHPQWAYVGLLPLFFALQNGEKRHALYSGWLSGFTFNLLCLYWVAYTQGGGSAVVGGTLLLAIYLGLFVAIWALVIRKIVAHWGIFGWLAAPALWTTQEYALSLGELGFPWLLLGHAQSGQTNLIQFASITGVYGVSFWVVSINVLLFLLCYAHGTRRAALGIALVALFALPWTHARSAINQVTPAQSLRIALIQPNLSIEEKWGYGGLERSLERLERLSYETVARRPELIVWPETALPCYLALTADCRRQTAALVDEINIPLLTGASHYDRTLQQPYNAAFFLQPNRIEIPHYAKMHLVPFGERTPYRDRIPLLGQIDWTKLTGDLGPAEFAPGRQRTIFSHERANFAVLICFESVFPDLVRRHVLAGAQVLINITNDSWFGRSAGPYQHALLNAMRAIENRVAIARSATSGQSLFIDQFGRRYQTSEIFTEAALVGNVSVAQSGSFYSRNGNVFAHSCLLFSAFCFIALRVRNRTDL